MEINSLGNSAAFSRTSADATKVESGEGKSLNSNVSETSGGNREAETSPIPPVNPTASAPSDESSVSSEQGGNGGLIDISA